MYPRRLASDFESLYIRILRDNWHPATITVLLRFDTIVSRIRYRVIVVESWLLRRHNELLGIVDNRSPTDWCLNLLRNKNLQRWLYYLHRNFDTLSVIRLVPVIVPDCNCQ